MDSFEFLLLFTKISCFMTFLFVLVPMIVLKYLITLWLWIYDIARKKLNED